MIRAYLIFFVVFVLAAIPISAKKVDSPEAKQAGLFHLDEQHHTWHFQMRRGLIDQEAPEYAITNVRSVTDETNGEVLFYVLQLAPEGFMVVSPDTDIQPVIAYSYYGHFPMEDSADNTLLQMLKSDMRSRLAAIPATDESLKMEHKRSMGTGK
ncbi:MAG: hypothetical protein GY940_12765 [bacterium]|nr:hypothetical protein [bacterium]